MSSCKDGRCSIRVIQPNSPSRVSSGVSGDTARSYKGTLYYPLLEVQLITENSIPVQGHVRMKTGIWGLLCSEEGDTVPLISQSGDGSQNPGYFAADMRRGVVTIDVTNARCGKGFPMRNKTFRFVHWRKEKRQLIYLKSEAIVS